MTVFISSTRLDLKEHRARTAEAIHRLGEQYSWMETFGARPASPSEVSLQEVKKCDVFVGIYAHRYGDGPSQSDISFTEMEFDEAKELGKKRFCFLVDEDFDWPFSLIEKEPGQSKLRTFKEKVLSTEARETFTTPDNLAYKLAASLGLFLRERSERLAKENMARQRLHDQFRAAGQLGHDQFRAASGLP